MDAESFLKLSKEEIYSDKYISGYINLYKKTFGSQPSCSSCTFNRDHRRLFTRLNNSNNTVMSKKSNKYKIASRDNNKIFWYRDKKTKDVHRVMGYNIDDDFATAYLENGGDIAIFIEVPEKDVEKPKESAKATPKQKKAPKKAKANEPKEKE